MLPDGCYYDEAGAAILKVEGDTASLLIPARVRRVKLIRGRNTVVIDPGFYLRDPPRSAGEDPEPHAFTVPIDRTAPRPTMLINVEAWGQEKVALGKPC